LPKILSPDPGDVGEVLISSISPEIVAGRLLGYGV
jgi:ABC-type Na+ efflux pump permease subunit